MKKVLAPDPIHDQNVGFIVSMLFYFAIFVALAGTAVIQRCQPAPGGIWCVIAVTGVCYGIVLISMSIVLGLVTAALMDLFVGTNSRLVDWVYGSGLAFCLAIDYSVVLPLAGTAVSIIAAATELAFLVFGYCHDKK